MALSDDPRDRNDRDLAARLAPHLPNPQPPVTVEDHGTYLTLTIGD